MGNTVISYHQIMVKDLVSFADEIISAASPGDFVPISDQRAIAMANNPAATPNDVAMMVAKRENEVVGYFGIMPIWLWHHGKKSKVHWFSTWNVSPKVRGQGVGSNLMKESLKIGLDFLIVGSKPARDVSRKFGFLELPPLNIATLNFASFWRFNPITLLFRGLRKLYSIFGKRIEILKVTEIVEKGLHSLFGGILKSILYASISKKNKGKLSGISWKRVEGIENLNIPSDNEVKFYRDEEIINWMLGYPWVVAPGNSRTENMDFYFSDVRVKFENIAYEIFNEGQSLGYITCQLSGSKSATTLKVEDVKLANQQLVFPIMLNIAKSFDVDMFSMNSDYFDLHNFSRLEKSILSDYRRVYQCFPADAESPLGKYWQEIQLDFPDGDMGFS